MRQVRHPRGAVVRVVVIAALALACTSVATAARAQGSGDAAGDAGARRMFRVAQAHYENGDFEQAAAGFEEAYRLSGRPQLLYNTYIAYRDAQNIPQAVHALRRYLEQVPDAPDRDQLRAKLERMQAALERLGASATVEPDDTDDRGIDTRAMGPQEEAASRGPAEGPDGAGGTGGAPEASRGGGGPPGAAIAAGGVGLAMIAGGVVTGLMTSSAQSELEEGCPSRTGCDPALEDTQSRGKTLALVTDVLLFGGLAAVGTGVVLWLLSGGAGAETGPGDAVASVGCGADGCGGSLRVGF